MSSDFTPISLPSDNLNFQQGRGQMIVNPRTVPADYTGIQLPLDVYGSVSGVHSYYQGQVQWYTNSRGQLCSGDGVSFRLGRNGVVIKSKSSELLG